ncbi:hornerin-like isoform X2 [Phymastichus coffea]|uniref:hornerin-like isoform X2 n=1 Tax=Phymastichus coffea TaxID=108790 RepID=UPI00273CBAB5|nr:hornerin-like isoform X2 [Phymastichus coffea]
MMLRFALLLLFALCLVVRSDERLTSKTNALRNTPPELISADKVQVAADSQVQARFLPFAASFSLNPGGEHSQTFSIAGSPEGIGLSQSSSQGSGSFSASQSSSIAAGLNGLSASDSSAFNHNHPLHGPQSQATGNSFAVGQAGASSHGDVINGQAVSSAQSSVGGVHTQASSGASSGTSQNLVHSRPDRPNWNNVRPSYSNGYNVPSYGNGYDVPPNYASGYKGDYYHNSYRNSARPSLTISVSDDMHHYNPRASNGWDPRCRSPRVTITKPGGYYRPTYNNRVPYYENIKNPRQSNLHVSNVHAESSAQSNPGSIAIGNSMSEVGCGHLGLTSSTTNHVESSGNANAHAQGASGSMNYHPNNLQASLSSGSITTNSRPGGFSQGTSHSSSTGGSSTSNLHGFSSGGASTHGSAMSGSILFPGPSSQVHMIPQKFIRSSKKGKHVNPFDELAEDLTDTVYDIFDY